MGKVPNSVTIKDVAKRADVSIATVSHVIHKTRFVSEDLTKRVNDAINELGFYPNLLVGSLRKGKTYTVGLVMPSISNETFGLLAETIQKMLFKCGYNLIICTTSYDVDIEKEAFNTLLTKKVDAIITIPTAPEGEKLKEIQNLGIPIVLVDRVIPDVVADTIRLDNFLGAHDAVEYLIGLGHRNIGYIDRKVEQSHSYEQKEGYRQALEEHGIEFDPGKVVRAGGFDYRSGTEAVKTLISKNPDLTAIFAYYDITAFGVMRGIMDLGYRVPEEFSVIGCDGMPFTDASNPRLTTISFPVQRMAKLTCDVLLKRLEPNESKVEKAQDIVIVPRLILRDSTAAPRSERKPPQ